MHAEYGSGEMEETFYCSICNKPMSPSSEIVSCSFCGKREKADYVCPENHYICEECRLATSDKLVEKACKASKEKDPMKLALLLMKHPAVPMHGPVHHYLVGSVILAALRNLDKFKIDDIAFDWAISRGKQVILASCALWGACGAAISVGTAVSIATKATFMSDRERSLAMQATSEALSEIAKLGGPRCSKASTFTAIEAAARFFEREFDIKFANLTNPRPCYFKTLNKDCLGPKCPYYR
jgi:hypothetical protein